MISASIVIVTRNRCEDALTAVASAWAQDLPDLEVLLIDDASEDETARRVGADFPGTRVISLRERAGYIVGRNLGFREAKGKYVFSLDDDAYFTGRDTASRIISRFERDHTIGAIAIPFLEPLARRSNSSLVHALRAKPGDELRSYVGCAHALQRDLALALGGYREFFVHQGEERDLCLRMRAAGWRIVYGDCDPVVHMVSPRRDALRVSHYGIRNQILFEALNAPSAYLPLRLLTSIAGTLRYRFSLSTTPAKLHAIYAGLTSSLEHASERRPVSSDIYRTFRRLPYHGPENWEGKLPQPCVSLLALA